MKYNKINKRTCIMLKMEEIEQFIKDHAIEFNDKNSCSYIDNDNQRVNMVTTKFINSNKNFNKLLICQEINIRVFNYK